jgi:hypothetical protein
MKSRINNKNLSTSTVDEKTIGIDVDALDAKVI